MMTSNATHKIAVGIGMAAVFGLGVSVFAVRVGHESQYAANARPATFDQNGTDDSTASAENAAAPMPADQVVISSSASPPAPTAVAPTAIAPTIGSDVNDSGGASASDQSKASRSKASDRPSPRAAKSRRGGDTSGTDVAPAANPVESPTDGNVSNGLDSPAVNKELAPTAVPSPVPTRSDSRPPAPPAATADTQPALAWTKQEAATNGGSAVTSDAPVISDSQITSFVKAEIAVVAPAGKFEVSTTNGIVALVGSVPSQDTADQVKLLAQRVSGVKQVDTTALAVVSQ